jgi:site-specific DNA-methyltransferase (adenine-specific)
VKYELKLGDNAKTLKQYPDNHFDSIVTDPPYGIEFMGKDWDKHTGAVETWNECFRVLKPGGHILAFSASRTYHHLATNIESVGFEIRDQIMWIYGSGFPKSHNIGKAVDKKLGNKRKFVGQNQDIIKKQAKDLREGKRKILDSFKAGEPNRNNGFKTVSADITKGNTEWEGWGTALKPAHEPIVMARKPLSEKTIVDNVLKHGTGGINIDECRVGTDEKLSIGSNNRKNANVNFGMKNDKKKQKQNEQGRFPANIIHDGSEEVLEGFPETGKSAGGRSYQNTNKMYEGGWDGGEGSKIDPGFGDSGSAARFFYCAKVSKKERNIGQSTDGKNNHPTVKPVALMKYLITLITPKGGKVLDPFNGSGSTGMACVELGYEYTGCELDPDYIEISKARIEAWYAENKPEEVNEYFDKI